MYGNLTVGAVIPAHNEEADVGAVVEALLGLRTEDAQSVIDDLVVCDNGSTDATARIAQRAGARVAPEPKLGYGSACLAAIAALHPVDVVLFVDGDRSFDVEQSLRLLAAIDEGADLAIGSRTLGNREPGALSVPQRAGNLVASWMIRLLWGSRVASWMIRLLWGSRVTDLGPFRAIRADALQRLQMRDRAYGWTVEMQIKAIQANMRVVEAAVDSYRRRFGKSKVGGTLKGVVGASLGILSMIARLWLQGSTRHADGGGRGKP